MTSETSTLKSLVFMTLRCRLVAQSGHVSKSPQLVLRQLVWREDQLLRLNLFNGWLADQDYRRWRNRCFFCARTLLPANWVEPIKVSPGQRASLISNDAGTPSVTIE